MPMTDAVSREEKYDLSLRLEAWVDECAAMTRPDNVVWCDGSREEYDRLIKSMLADGAMFPLNQEANPGCFLHRSNPNDVARVEQFTFICSRSKADAGPTNNWMDPADAKAHVGGLFSNCMSARTMYVIPYIM